MEEFQWGGDRIWVTLPVVNQLIVLFDGSEENLKECFIELCKRNDLKVNVHQNNVMGLGDEEK